MGNKIINLFNNSDNVEHGGSKYSDLVQEFMAAFSDDFSDVEYFEDILEFTINAWNFGNMRVIFPEQEFEEIIAMVTQEISDDREGELLNKMTAYKVENFSEYSNFILDYEIEETENDTVLTLTTQEEDDYFSYLFGDMESDFSEEEYEENYINRTAIILKPLQPFFDWCSNLYPEETDEINEINTYLISEDIDDVEAWLKKKFDTLFKYQLETWHTNKKEWPQRRNYKMFKEWFQVDISKMVFDVEKHPVSKV